MSDNIYKTKQRAVILDCLKENSENAMSVDEIVYALKQKGSAVGRTTVYRYTDSLCKSGEVRRFSDGSSKSATFQYVAFHKDCENHMHLKCTNCGKLEHLSCDFMNGVCGHIMSHHKFMVDNSKTTLFGLCEECLAKEKNNGSY